MATNITGLFLCSQVVGRQMIKQCRGKIINISSIYGEVGMNSSLYSDDPNSSVSSIAFHASKAGVINFTRGLAVAWARYNIQVNCISPGAFPLEINEKSFPPSAQQKFLQRIPLRRFGREEDLKGAIVFLASRASDYITGINLVVDGGYTAL